MKTSCCGGSCGPKSLVWECMGCGYRETDINTDLPLEECPECGLDADYFVQVDAGSLHDPYI